MLLSTISFSANVAIKSITTLFGAIMATLINTEMGKTEIEPKNGVAFTLQELQKYVGGFIEIINLPENQAMIINEEGLLEGLPLNRLASFCVDRKIVGNVVICTKHAGELRA